MSTPGNNPHNSQQPSDDGFNVESFLTAINRVSQLESKFFVYTEAIKNRPDSVVSGDIIKELREEHHADLINDLNASGSGQEIRVVSSEARTKEGNILIRSEATTQEANRVVYTVPVSQAQLGNEPRETRHEYFREGRAGLIVEYDVAVDEEGDNFQFSGFANPQLDTPAFREAIRHLRETFGPNGAFIPSCLREVLNKTVLLITAAVTNELVRSKTGLDGDDLYEATRLELQRYAKVRVPDIREAKILAEEYGLGAPSAIIRAEVIVMPVMIGQTLISRMIRSMDFELGLDEMGVPQISLVGSGDVYAEDQ